MSDFTDQQRMLIAREEHNNQNFLCGQRVKLADNTDAGIVTSFVRGMTGVSGDRDSGLDALVVKMKGQKPSAYYSRGQRTATIGAKTTFPFSASLPKAWQAKMRLKIHPKSLLSLKNLPAS
ncbi:hypothetical protein ACOVJL_02625 [Scardovia wiggsiae]|uniref:hypothetical protein n=1 Tax=Scardovia wiggsiae TaxID=230143 RepID=UPI003BAD2476